MAIMQMNNDIKNMSSIGWGLFRIFDRGGQIRLVIIYYIQVKKILKPHITYLI